MIADQFEKLSKDHFLEVNLIAVANSKKMLFDESGLSLESGIERMNSDGVRMSMDDFVLQMLELNLSNSILVDCTASESVTDHYETVLSASISIVTPNKKANSGPLAKYKKLRSVSFKRGVKFLYETNVGAGLPVINTINDLLLSGDRVISIQAVLSGTLNFVFSSFNEGMKFSDVVLEAKERGFTEPDPRDDLNGIDVARKTLILAREAGLHLELTDIDVENLVPGDCRGALSLNDFFMALRGHDEEFELRRKNAADQNAKLRYMAILENNKIKIHLACVGEAHPFYSLAGSDNIILLTTERYQERPMIIRGPGAGAEVTAAGVFADIIRIGNYSSI